MQSSLLMQCTYTITINYLCKQCLSPVNCYLLCMLPPLSGEPLLQRIFIHYWSVVYISYEFCHITFYTLYGMWNIFKHFIVYTGCGTVLKRVCHNTRTLLSYLHFYARTYKSIYRLITKTHPSMHIIMVKSKTHPSMHIIVLKSKTHRCGKIKTHRCGKI